MPTRPLIAAVALLAAAPAAADVHKCIDARGRVLYTQEPCARAGAKHAKTLDRRSGNLSIVPAVKAAAPAAPASGTPLERLAGPKLKRPPLPE